MWDEWMGGVNLEPVLTGTAFSRYCVARAAVREVLCYYNTPIAVLQFIVVL